MRLLAVASLLISFTSMACPDLSGTYAVCRSNTGRSSSTADLTITQALDGKDMVYYISETDLETNERSDTILKADGKTYIEIITIPEVGEAFQASHTTKCEGNELKMESKLTADGEVLGWGKFTVKKVGARLIIDAHGSDIDGDFTEQRICE